MKGICSMSQLGRRSRRWKVTLNIQVGQQNTVGGDVFSGGSPFYIQEETVSLKSNFPFGSLCFPNYLLSKKQKTGGVNRFGESCSIKLFNPSKKDSV